MRTVHTSISDMSVLLLVNLFGLIVVLLYCIRFPRSITISKSNDE